MRHNAKSRPKSVRSNQRPRTNERNSNTEGVYGNNFFMHAATSQVGAVVKLETIQGTVYEGIFKTFSQDFDVVLELAHKVDNNDPGKINAHEVGDNLIFQAKDIVYMNAQNVDLHYAFKDSFTDSAISKYNGEPTGEKKLEPYEGFVGNGEDCDLENTDNSQQNGWDAFAMFEANKELGVGSSYDDSLAAYTVQIHRKDTKDFKEEEAKAARIAMEIERNPSSQARSALENGENEEELFAAVTRPEVDGKYVPPQKRKSSQNLRTGSGGGAPRGNYSANGNQRSFNVPESPGRQQMNNSATISRYHHQAPQQYHQSQPHGSHSQSMRENSNRSSPENKNANMCATAVTQPQNIPPYSTTMHQQRTFPQNVAPVTNHSQNTPMQPKSQRTSPISVPVLSNGNVVDYQPKPIPTVPQTPHQYHSQSQPPQNANVTNNQRKHQHHSNSRGREDQINDLKKFGSEFTLKDTAEVPKQIQVVTNRNKSPPTMQTPATERNVVTVSIVPTLPPNKHTTTSPITQANIIIPSSQTTLASSKHATSSNTQPPMIVPPSTTTANSATPTVPVLQPPANVPNQAAPTTQVMKTHPQHVMSQQTAPYQPARHQTPMQPSQNHQSHQGHQGHQSHQMHMPQREPQVMMPQQMLSQQQQQQPPSQQPSPPPPPPILPHKQPKQSHPVPMHQSPQSQNVPVQQHQVIPSQNKPVINSQHSVQGVHAQSVLPPNHTQTVTQQNVNTQCVHSPVVQRSPSQPQQSIKSTQSSSSASSASPPPQPSSQDNSETDSGGKNAPKEHDEELDDVSSTLKKSTLNPNAKEFVYNPAPKSFTPVSRSPSTPTQSRPHTPQTPSYNVHSANAAAAAGIQMVVPTAYVVSAQPTAYVPAAPPQSSRLRKVTVGPHRTEYHPSNMQVAAATGQPLLAPSVTLAQSALAPGTQFAVQGYTPHPHLAAAAAAAAAAQPYQHLQMVRMVPQQGGGMVPLVPSSISYHDTSGSGATAMYVNHGSGAAVAMTPHTPHVHHPQQHPPPSTAPSPSQTPQGPSQSHTPNSYQQPPIATQSAPPYPPIMCPLIQAPPPHGPPHHMVATPAQQHAMQQYIQHPQGYQRR